MQISSGCHGPCVTCMFFGMGCLAGHGEDYYHVAPLSVLEERLQSGGYSDKDLREIMKEIEIARIRLKYDENLVFDDSRSIGAQMTQMTALMMAKMYCCETNSGSYQYGEGLVYDELAHHRANSKRCEDGF